MNLNLPTSKARSKYSILKTQFLVHSRPRLALPVDGFVKRYMSGGLKADYQSIYQAAGGAIGIRRTLSRSASGAERAQQIQSFISIYTRDPLLQLLPNHVGRKRGFWGFFPPYATLHVCHSCSRGLSCISVSIVCQHCTAGFVYLSRLLIYSALLNKLPVTIHDSDGNVTPD